MSPGVAAFKPLHHSTTPAHIFSAQYRFMCFTGATSSLQSISFPCFLVNPQQVGATVEGILLRLISHPMWSTEPRKAVPSFLQPAMSR